VWGGCGRVPLAGVRSLPLAGSVVVGALLTCPLPLNLLRCCWLWSHRRSSLEKLGQCSTNCLELLRLASPSDILASQRAPRPRAVARYRPHDGHVNSATKHAHSWHPASRSKKAVPTNGRAASANQRKGGPRPDSSRDYQRAFLTGFSSPLNRFDPNTSACILLLPLLAPLNSHAKSRDSDEKGTKAVLG
jgi:hypothetical protein